MTYTIIETNNSFDLEDVFWEGPDTLRYTSQVPNSIRRNHKIGSFPTKEKATEKLNQLLSMRTASPDVLFQILVETILDKSCPQISLIDFCVSKQDWLGSAQEKDIQKNANTFRSIPNVQEWLLGLDKYERPRILAKKFERLTLKKARQYIEKVIGDY